MSPRRAREIHNVTIDRETYRHRRRTIFRILDMLRSFIETETWDVEDGEGIDPVEANTVSFHYEKLVAFMTENGAHTREDFEPESGAGREEANARPSVSESGIVP